MATSGGAGRGGGDQWPTWSEADQRWEATGREPAVNARGQMWPPRGRGRGQEARGRSRGRGRDVRGRRRPGWTGRAGGVQVGRNYKLERLTRLEWKDRDRKRMAEELGLPITELGDVRLFGVQHERVLKDELRRLKDHKKLYLTSVKALRDKEELLMRQLFIKSGINEDRIKFPTKVPSRETVQRIKDHISSLQSRINDLPEQAQGDTPSSPDEAQADPEDDMDVGTSSNVDKQETDDRNENSVTSDAELNTRSYAPVDDGWRQPAIGPNEGSKPGSVEVDDDIANINDEEGETDDNDDDALATPLTRTGVPGFSRSSVSHRVATPTTKATPTFKHRTLSSSQGYKLDVAIKPDPDAAIIHPEPKDEKAGASTSLDAKVEQLDEMLVKDERSFDDALVDEATKRSGRCGDEIREREVHALEVSNAQLPAGHQELRNQSYVVQSIFKASSEDGQLLNQRKRRIQGQPTGIGEKRASTSLDTEPNFQKSGDRSEEKTKFLAVTPAQVDQSIGFALVKDEVGVVKRELEADEKPRLLHPEAGIGTGQFTTSTQSREQNNGFKALEKDDKAQVKREIISTPTSAESNGSTLVSKNQDPIAVFNLDVAEWVKKCLNMYYYKKVWIGKKIATAEEYATLAKKLSHQFRYDEKSSCVARGCEVSEIRIDEDMKDRMKLRIDMHFEKLPLVGGRIF